MVVPELGGGSEQMKHSLPFGYIIVEQKHPVIDPFGSRIGGVSYGTVPTGFASGALENSRSPAVVNPKSKAILVF